MEEMAGILVRSIAKAEPLKVERCSRLDCYPCNSGGGNCEKNESGYQVSCETGHLDGISRFYEEQSGCNSYTMGREHLMPSGWKMKTVPPGKIV